MKVNDFINLLREETDNQNLDIRFESYEWTDDLEDLEYLEREFDGVAKENNSLVIRISR